MSKSKMIAIGAGVAAVSAGAYALLGPSGKKNQAKVKAFARKMEKKVMPKIKEMQKMKQTVVKKAMPNVKKMEKIVKKTVADLNKN